MVGRWVVFGIAAAAVCACSLITSLQDLKNDDADAADAGVDDAALVDASVQDASLDAPITDAGAITFCSTVDASFCDDFETIQDVNFLGLGLFAQNGLAVVKDAESFSAPFALDTYVPAIEAGMGRAVIYRALPIVAPTSVYVEFEARPVSQSTNSSMFELGFASNGADWHLQLIIHPSSIYLREYIVGADGGTTSTNHTTVSLAWGDQYRRLQLLWSWSASGATSAYSIDNTPIESTQSPYELTPGWPNTSASLTIGIDNVTGPALNNNFYFDNIIVDYQ